MRWLLITTFQLTVALALFPGLAIAQTSQGDRFRQLPRFPTIRSSCCFDISPLSGPQLVKGPATLLRQLAALSDAPRNEALRYARAAELLADADAHFLARLAHGKAAALYRAQLKDTPQNPEALAGLGTALSGSAQRQEAEPLLRRACELAPDNWRMWTALAWFLAWDLDACLLDFDGGGAVTPQRVHDLVMEGKLPRANVEKAKQRLQEAMACADRAVALAPDEAAVYYVRCRVRRIEIETGNLIRLALGELVSPVVNAFTQERAADLMRAAQLRTEDPVVLAAAVHFQWMVANTQQPSPNGGQPKAVTLLDLSPNHQTATCRAMAQLEKWAAGKEMEPAADAAQALALLQLTLLHDGRQMEVSARRALALDPARPLLWDWLTASLFTFNRSADALVLAQERLKYEQSAQAHFMVAMVHSLLGQWDQAEKHVRIALDLDPDHLNARFGLAACLLRRATNPEILGEAGAAIPSMDTLAKGNHLEADVVDQQLHLTGVYRALCGKTEEARQAFLILTKRNPRDVESTVALRWLAGSTVPEEALRAAVRLPEKAEEQLRLGLQVEPNDLLCNLGLAAFLLKRDDVHALGDAIGCLERATAAVTRDTPNDYLLDLDALGAVVYILLGNRLEAERLLGNVLTRNPEHLMGKAVRKVLDCQ